MQLATRAETEQQAGEQGVPKRFAHQPALDGLRGLAVAAVVLHHQGFPEGWGRGGFLGVDIFFVLSGFLITSLLLIDHSNTGHVVSVGFWARRAKRLLPPLLILLLMVAAYAAFIAKPYELGEIRTSSFATLFYVYNFWLLNPAHRGGPWLLSHTWSLSIEEQFYLVWPILLAVLVRVSRGRKALLLGMIGVLTAVSIGLLAATYKVPDFTRANLGTDTRAHALLIGAGLGIAMLGWRGPATRRGRIALEASGIVAFLLLLRLLWTVDFYNSGWLYHGGFPLVAVASATVIAACVQSTSPVLRPLLSWRPLMALGLISYGVYLYHWPIYVWLNADRVGFGGIPLFLVRLAVTGVVSIASYFLVERPIRRGNWTWPRVRIVVPAAVLIVVAALLVSTLGAQATTPTVLGEIFYSGLVQNTPPGATRVLVAGDAVAYQLGTATGGAYQGAGIVGATTAVLGCPIGSGSVAVGRDVRAQPACDDWPATFKSAVGSFKPGVSVLMLGTDVAYDRVVDGQRLRVGTPAFRTYLLGQLDAADKILTANGSKLVLLTTPCTYVRARDGSAQDPLRGRIAIVNAVFAEFAARHADSVRVGNYAGFICKTGVPRTVIHHLPANWSDGAAITAAGATASWRWIAGSALSAKHELGG